MPETDTTRTPPEIIFVPPPDKPAIPRARIAGILIWTACVSIAMLIVGLVTRALPVSVWAITWGTIFAGLITTLGLSYWRRSKAMQTSRRSFLEKHPDADVDPRATALGKTWKIPDRLPKLPDVQAALRDTHSEAAATRAVIVCFGEPDVPQVGELHFEPEIITPTGAIWRQLIWLAFAGALLGLLLLDQLRLLPAWIPGIRPFLGVFTYFLAAGAIALAVWVWRGMIRPTYVRMAPGVIQILQYRYSKSRPSIRSYPVQPGTLAILTRIRKHLILTLSRGENKDMLLFSRMQQPAQKIERTWQALLSTAPTPPLSDDALVG